MEKQQRGYNKVPNVTVRLTQDLYDWLLTYSEVTGQPKNKIFKEALELLMISKLNGN